THTFTNGVILETTGDQYVRVNDGAAQGEQANITVNPAALGSFTVAGVNDPHVAGVAQSPIVTAFDIFGNVKTDYTGTITLSSSDGSATLPADYSFVLGDSGVHTFTNGVTFETSGDHYLRVNDGAAQGDQADITVNPSALGSFTVAGINDP